MLALDLLETQWCENEGKIEKIEGVHFFAAFAFPPDVVKIATARINKASGDVKTTNHNPIRK